MSWQRAIHVDAVAPGQTRVVEIDGEPLLVCRLHDGRVCVIEDTCSHDDGPLGEGTLDGSEVTCPRHGARFDVCSGRAVTMPAAAPVEVFPSRIADDGFVEVALEE